MYVDWKSDPGMVKSFKRFDNFETSVPDDFTVALDECDDDVVEDASAKLV